MLDPLALMQRKQLQFSVAVLQVLQAQPAAIAALPIVADCDCAIPAQQPVCLGCERAAAFMLLVQAQLTVLEPLSEAELRHLFDVLQTNQD